MCTLHGGAHVGRAFGDFDAGCFQGCKLLGRSAFAAANNGASVAHAFARRCGAAGDKRRDRLGNVLLYVGGGFFFGGTADSPIIKMASVPGSAWNIANRSTNKVPTMRSPPADASRLAKAKIRKLPNRFVSKRAAAAHDADFAGLVNVPWHDADFALAGRDDTGAVWADEDRLAATHNWIPRAMSSTGTPSVMAMTVLMPASTSFQNGVGSKTGRYENNGGVGTGFFDGSIAVSIRAGLPPFRRLCRA